MRKCVNWEWKTPILITLAALLALLAAGTAYAKYVKDYPVPQGIVNVTANVGDVAIDAPTEYLLIPGHDFSLNRTVTVSNLSALPVYLFVEVEGGVTGVTYQGTANWINLNLDGRNVFVYETQVSKNANDSQTFPVDILAVVPQGIKDEAAADVTLTAYLGQVYDKSAAEIFTELFGTP